MIDGRKRVFLFMQLKFELIFKNPLFFATHFHHTMQSNYHTHSFSLPSLY
jgi:hypothetical protein